MSVLLSKLMRNFEHEFGYPPGENYLLTATPEYSHAATEVLSSIDAPGELIGFYQVVNELSMPDVESGFFIHSYEDVVNGVEGKQPTCLAGSIDDEIIVFGSDGGGGLFALNRTDGQIHRLGRGSLIGSTYEIDESCVVESWPDFWEFLNYLHCMLSEFISFEWR